MRLSYVSNPPATSNEEDESILQRVQARRGQRGLLPLDLALLHSFPIADGWNSFLGAIRTKTSLPADIREIAICRVAAMNEAWFEWKGHAPILTQAGFSEDALKLVERGAENPATDTELAALMSPKQIAVYKYTEEMTRIVKVSDEVFEELRRHFSEKEMVEITATVGAYNCVSRFLVALDVGEMNR
ncbi:4-carboxymuconolactone decarboxylase [Histoplasma capsulatum G186AR]|uniref:4-carboxymuconolactone decarboxylase n=2 Tax=Ajellomyces capsulatus TaxID=5037 RepID=C0NBM7_AJECG|nr:4-carboxymuconolactone decarboxylase [Histoplasma capsulatum G186AR]EEH11068.1 4-carboxymuconolactone decarboxylase [Histoplasma capsulatum G186AR]KAG5303083.1 4-carboxymuconolactone decarboxylase [Histoplasma capsulatum]QSS71515.1 4-carboxymuconolactone decarboxylase [Histoplasma capsulatum G186AR]